MQEVMKLNLMQVGLTSGIYFYRLAVGKFHGNKETCIVKIIVIVIDL